MFKTVKIRDGHDNFFTPLRLFFAVMVVAGHAYVIIHGDPTYEPSLFFQYSPSYLAVNLFFIASGFLVTKSMLFRGDSAAYTAARSLRIYPALLVHVLFVMFVIGPLVTSLPFREFVTHPDVLKQPVAVLSFINTDMIMPGAFERNAEQLGSAPLWTLRYEILAYIGTLLLFSLGLMRRKWMLLGQLVVPAFFWILTHSLGVFDTLPGTAQNVMRFGIAYGLGASIFAFKDQISFNGVGLVVLTALAALTHSWQIGEIMMNFMLAHLVFWLAYQKAPKLARLTKMSDYSYGIYIYHWCVLQTLFYFWPSLTILQIFLTGLVITTVLAYASWHLVEKPMLTRKASFADLLRFGREKNSKASPKLLVK